MCGIAGTIGRGWTEEQFERLFASVHHRGRDGSGMTQIGSIRLGMHRFLLRGPVVTLPPADDRSAWAYNGQVYACFGSKDEFEPSLLDEVRAVSGGSADGMFAIASVDKAASTVRLLTDPDFIKPLFYLESTQGLAFCSEFAPLASIERPPRINWDALAELFAFGWYLGPDTWIDGVCALTDHELLVEGERVIASERQVCHVPTPRDIRAAVSLAVRRCVDGKGPFGLALSGGVDSTILAWELNSLGIENITTFSVRVPRSEDGLTSLEQLDFPAKGAWRTWRHIVVDVPDASLREAFRSSVLAFGQPTTMSSLPLVWRLANVAAEAGIRVMLSGEGVDELFGGYGSYSKVPQLRHVTDYYFHPPRQEVVKTIFGTERAHAVSERFKSRFEEIVDLRHIERKMRLPRLLLRNDVCFMAHTVESRTPFLHNGVPEFALSLDLRNELSGGGKATLRRAWQVEIGSRAAMPKTRFKAGDISLRYLLGERDFCARLSTVVKQLFGGQAEVALARLLYKEEFDADIACLLISLCYLQGELDIR